MTQLAIIGNSRQTMSSREIAELTGKQHKHVLVDIAKMLVELEEDEPTFRHIYFDSMNREQREYQITKELTEVLLTGYSAKLRRIVIARWNELEAQRASPAFTLPDFTNPAAAARAWADAIEQKQESDLKAIQAAEQLALAAPKAEALDRITLSDGSMCLTNAAKVLGVQPKKFFAWMQEHQWIYRRAGGAGFTGYQARIQVGYLDHKVTTVSRSDGSDKTVEQVLVTSKGLAKLAGLMQIVEAA